MDLAYRRGPGWDAFGFDFARLVLRVGLEETPAPSELPGLAGEPAPTRVVRLDSSDLQVRLRRRTPHG